MTTESSTIAYCVNGTQAEYEGRLDEAAILYQQAWDAALDDTDRCVAAHYLARIQDSPEATHRWNIIALAHADAVTEDRIRGFYPSLYINLGRSHELLGEEAEARHYYKMAADLGLDHQEESKPYKR